MVERLLYLVIIAVLIIAIKILKGKKWVDIWEYGTCNETKARRNRVTGEVQFVLWKAGEQGHETDYWHQFDSSWWSMFKLENEK